MDKIFMTCVEKAKDSGKVKLAVFLKGKKEHLKDLMGFLQNQKVDCSEIPQQQQREMQEFAYFDEGFHMIVEPDRWSFYELKSYIQTYANTWDDDVVLRDTLLQELRTCDEGLIFDEHFYLELSKQIDKCEDRYYQENMSTSLFISGILKILRHNLQLYWAAAKLIETKNKKESYLNYDPPSLPREKIFKACNSASSKSVIRVPVDFYHEHIADIFVRPGPFSPKPSVINKFLSYVIMYIDDFIYGAVTHKRLIYRLQSEIAELRRQQQAARPYPSEEREYKTRKKLRLLLIGATELNAGQIFAECSKFDFDKSKVDLYNDYKKLTGFDTNNLLAIRSKYDGILLGPMPHKMKGDFTDDDSLIAQMQREPRRYPPFVILYDKGGTLKITKTSLISSLKEIVSKITQIENYSVQAN